MSEIDDPIRDAARAVCGYPPEAVAAARLGQGHDMAPPRATEAVYWAREARGDIAEHGVDWAAGHAEGLHVASSLAGWSGEVIGRAVETGRPDPYAGYSDAWVAYEDAAQAERAAVAAAATPSCVAELDATMLTAPPPVLVSTPFGPVFDCGPLPTGPDYPTLVAARAVPGLAAAIDRPSTSRTRTTAAPAPAAAALRVGGR